jgi:hypothetical protein
LQEGLLVPKVSVLIKESVEKAKKECEIEEKNKKSAT